METLRKEPTIRFSELFHDTTVLQQFESPFSDVTATIGKVSHLLVMWQLQLGRWVTFSDKTAAIGKVSHL